MGRWGMVGVDTLPPASIPPVPPLSLPRLRGTKLEPPRSLALVAPLVVLARFATLFPAGLDFSLFEERLVRWPVTLGMGTSGRSCGNLRPRRGRESRLSSERRDRSDRRQQTGRAPRHHRVVGRHRLRVVRLLPLRDPRAV